MKAHFNDYDLPDGVDYEAEIRYLPDGFYCLPHWHNGTSYYFDKPGCEIIRFRRHNIHDKSP